MSEDLTDRVELALEESAELGLEVRKLTVSILETVNSLDKSPQTEEVRKQLITLFQTAQGYTKNIGEHATILVAYQNSRLTKELVNQNKKLTLFTGVLAGATILLFVATIIVPFLR